METQEEKKRRRKAWITSICVQMIMLFIFYFLAAWRVPDPPNPEFGIELNFGLNQTGQGSVPLTSPSPAETSEFEETTTDSSQPNLKETDNFKESNNTIETTQNTDVVVKETGGSSSSKIEPLKKKKPSKANLNPKATFTTTDANSSQGNSGRKGDQGEPEGDINEDALYGNEGGGENGFSLQMSGWEWDSPPEPKDTSDESGRIVFEITVDADGYLIGSPKTILTTVSPQLTAEYRTSLELLTFSKTSSYRSASYSKGRITFIIRSK